MELHLENGDKIPVFNKTVLIVVKETPTTKIINRQGDYDFIFINGDSDVTFEIELEQPAVIVMVEGERNTVNVRGGLSIPLSKAIYIEGENNKINGLFHEYKGVFNPDFSSEDAVSFFEDNKIYIQ